MDIEEESTKFIDLSVHCIPQFKGIPCNSGNSEFVVDVHVGVTDREIRPDSERAPIDLVCVIDRSGSMSGMKMVLVKETLSSMIEQLGPKDKVAIVLFDSTIELLCDFISTDDAGRRHLKGLVDRIKTQGCTNLSGGLVRAMELLRSRTVCNDVSSTFLFTDGEANEGFTQFSDIIRALEDPSYKFSGEAAMQQRLAAASNVRLSNVQGINNLSVLTPQQQQQHPQAQSHKKRSVRFQRNDGNANDSSGSDDDTTVNSVQPQQQQQQPVVPQQNSLRFDQTVANGMIQQGQLFPSTMDDLNSAAIGIPPSHPSEKSEAKVTRLPIPGSINCFGFGSSHNEELLRKLATHARGMYYFIEDTSRIVQAFSDALGGLVSTAAQDIEVRLQAVGDVRLDSVLTRYSKRTEADGSVVVSIGDMQFGEKRDLLVQLDVPPSESEEDGQKLLRVSVLYTDLLSRSTASATSVSVVRRPSSAQDVGTEETHVSVQCNRYYAAKAMEDANVAAAQGELNGARRILREAIERIEGSFTATDSFCVHLVEDLRKCYGMLADNRTYQTLGSKSLTTNMMSHHYQRSTHQGYAAQSIYHTNSRDWAQEMMNLNLTPKRKSKEDPSDSDNA